MDINSFIPYWDYKRSGYTYFSMHNGANGYEEQKASNLASSVRLYRLSFYSNFQWIITQ